MKVKGIKIALVRGALTLSLGTSTSFALDTKPNTTKTQKHLFGSIHDSATWTNTRTKCKYHWVNKIVTTCKPHNEACVMSGRHNAHLSGWAKECPVR